MNSIDLISQTILKKKSTEYQNELLKHFYEKASKTEQQKINEIIVCICNYSLETILYSPESIKN